MKRMFLMLVAVMLFASCADLGLFNRRIKESALVKSDAVPSVIVASYNLKYPGISTEKWYKINNYLYAARFDLNGKNTYAYFSDSGVYIDYDDVDQYEYDQDDDFMDGWDYFDYDTRD